jgi:hypothetical protein
MMLVYLMTGDARQAMLVVVGFDKQVFYHLSHTPSPFAFSLFFR